MARVLARLRISKLTEESTSIDRQREHVQQWSDQHGHTIVGWAVDEDVSRSADPFSAPELGPWLTDPARVDQWDIMVAWRVDRLGAGWKLSKLLVWLKENGKDLACTTIPFPLSDPNGFLVFTLYADQSEKDWEGIKARNLDAHRKSREDGVYHGGPTPYWLTRVKIDGRWVLKIDPERAPVIERIIEEFLARRPLKAIADELTRDGILCPDDVIKIRRKKSPKGRGWKPHSILRILENPALCGIKATHRGPNILEIVRDSAGRPVRIHGDALISDGRWHEIQREIDRRRSLRAPRRESGASGLLRVAFCRTCRSPLYLHTSSRNGKSWPYYFDPGKHMRFIPTDVLEEIVHEEFISAVGNYPRLTPVFYPAEDHTIELDQARASYEELAIRYAKSTSSTARGILEKQLGALEGRMAYLETLPPRPARVEYEETGETYADVWEGMDTQERRRLMLDTGVQALVSQGDEGVRVDMVFPSGFLGRLGLPEEGNWALYSGTVPEHLRDYGDEKPE
ncbi:MAG: recombinase family protein [Acidobacterium ailaaui]|nr:recombinase family protein [Pseudacidobacterium ailaaui]